MTGITKYLKNVFATEGISYEFGTHLYFEFLLIRKYFNPNLYNNLILKGVCEKYVFDEVNNVNFPMLWKQYKLEQI
jgi:hypothetical protein